MLQHNRVSAIIWKRCAEGRAPQGPEQIGPKLRCRRVSALPLVTMTKSSDRLRADMVHIHLQSTGRVRGKYFPRRLPLKQVAPSMDNGPLPHHPDSFALLEAQALTSAFEKMVVSRTLWR